jgi:TM2 domain-containing membrane protein YozV
MSKPGIAAVLSFVVPGLGQAYNGDFFRAFVWFALAILCGVTILIGSMGIPSLIFHSLCAWAAYSRAQGKEPRAA